MPIEQDKEWILNKLRQHNIECLLIEGSKDSWWKLDRFFMFYDLRYGETGYSCAALSELIFRN